MSLSMKKLIWIPTKLEDAFDKMLVLPLCDVHFDVIQEWDRPVVFVIHGGALSMQIYLHPWGTCELLYRRIITVYKYLHVLS